MAPELIQAIISGVSAIAGAFVGGGAAIWTQRKTAETQRQLSDKQWNRQQQAETYVGLLGQLREIDGYHFRLKKAWSKNEDTLAVDEPKLSGEVTDRVNAFAPADIRKALEKAQQADREFRRHMRERPSGSGSPEDHNSPAGKAYIDFRREHGQITEQIRALLRPEG